MPIPFARRRSVARGACGPVVVAAALALAPQPVRGQMPAQLEIPPDTPVRDGFDVDRAVFWERPNFVPLRDPEWKPLSEALRAGDLDDDTPVVVFEAGGRTLVLVTSQMAYHHLAQGEMEGEPWMVTF